MFPDQTEALCSRQGLPQPVPSPFLSRWMPLRWGRFAKENLWSDLTGSTRETISGLLEVGLYQGDIDALKALVSLIKGGGSDYVYTPDEILEPTTFRDLVTYARRPSERGEHHPTGHLRRDGGTQVRAEMKARDRRSLRRGAGRGRQPSPVVVFFDGKDHWLADGFHRVLAHEKAGLVDIPGRRPR